MISFAFNNHYAAKTFPKTYQNALQKWDLGHLAREQNSRVPQKNEVQSHIFSSQVWGNYDYEIKQSFIVLYSLFIIQLVSFKGWAVSKVKGIIISVSFQTLKYVHSPLFWWTNFSMYRPVIHTLSLNIP